MSLPWPRSLESVGLLALCRIDEVKSREWLLHFGFTCTLTWNTCRNYTSTIINIEPMLAVFHYTLPRYAMRDTTGDVHLLVAINTAVLVPLLYALL